jgi:formate hydrogenlyase subunit 3/multisubunit Na+/H+ antiporter MnhD subunit
MNHSWWVILVVTLPLLATVSMVILGKRSVPWVLIVTFMSMGVTLSQLITVLLQQGPQYHTLAGWGAPLGIEWYVDGLVGFMLVMTAVVNGLIAIFIWQSLSSSHSYIQQASSQWLFWPVWSLLWSGINALYLSADLFNLYVSLTLISLTQVVIISWHNDMVACQAAMRYFLVTFTASLSFFLGIAFLYAAFGTVDMTLLAQEIEPLPTTWVAICLILIGILTQGAFFPGHFWWPTIAIQATPLANGLLIGLIFNSLFYLLLRFWLEIFPHDIFLAGLAYLLGIFGGIAIIYGALRAMRQTQPFSFLAYSIISQLGFLLLLFPLLENVAPLSQAILWNSAIYQIVSLTLTHTALFLSVGYFLPKSVSTEFDSIANPRYSLFTLLTWLLAGMTLMALPPSGGFLGKWWLIQTALVNGQWWWAIIAVVGVIMTVGYWYKFLQYYLLTGNFNKKEVIRQGTSPLGWQGELVPLILVILAVSLGIFYQLPLAFLIVCVNS